MFWIARYTPRPSKIESPVPDEFEELISETVIGNVTPLLVTATKEYPNTSSGIKILTKIIVTISAKNIIFTKLDIFSIFKGKIQ